MSRAHAILEAVRLTTNAEIAALEEFLNTSKTLKLEHILRILLTYLPEGTDPDTYIGLLQRISQEQERSELWSADRCPEQDDVPYGDQGKVRRLRLLPLTLPEYGGGTVDPLSRFLILQARKIDADTGSLDIIMRLSEPFVEHSEILRVWMISTLLPLLRLEYDYSPHAGTSLSLREFERMEGRPAIQAMLSKNTQRRIKDEKIEYGRDLRGLVGPWMYGETMRKRRKLDDVRGRRNSVATIGDSGPMQNVQEESEQSDWSYVNEWILDLGVRNFPRAVGAVLQWHGPSDVDYGPWKEDILPMDKEVLSERMFQYGQAGMAIIYATNEASMDSLLASRRVLLHIARLLKLDEPPDIKQYDAYFNSGVPDDYFESLSQTHLSHGSLIRPRNPITQASGHALLFLNVVLASCRTLMDLGCIRSTRAVSELVLFGNQSDQLAELRRVLHKLKGEKTDDHSWASARRHILWLRDWDAVRNGMAHEPRGVFCKIPLPKLETELLRAMLDAGCCSLSVNVYFQRDSPLPLDIVEDTVVSAALSAYDAASNGNRTRGGVRKASDIISAFRGRFPASQHFAQIAALLSATHSMSFYSLTLQHGVPFRPVNIRAHKDPMSLIGKILDQNPRSYTHLDDLLEIGQNLVMAGLGEPSQMSIAAGASIDNQERERLIAARRITKMAIETALAEDDFDTAYSYVVNRLSVAEKTQDKSDQSPVLYDDISWRAAYAAGRYPTSNSGSSALRRLEQRLELLSQALLIAPPSALSELIVVWQQCEKQMTDLVASEAAEEKQLEEKTDRMIPGGFAGESSPPVQKPRDPARSALQEEAPMGLFDVARGAAAAISKNAFPLRSGQKRPAAEPSSVQPRPSSTGSVDDLSDDSMARGKGAGRARKRDMVSNMVTGGLATGIGWVIGKLAFPLYQKRHVDILIRCPSSQTELTETRMKASIL